jgi:hypothetical protein
VYIFPPYLLWQSCLVPKVSIYFDGHIKSCNSDRLIRINGWWWISLLNGSLYLWIEKHLK